MKPQLLMFALALGGCAAARADVAQGSESRKTSEFHAIDVGGTISVEARIGPPSIEVRGDVSHLKDVSTTVTNGVLVIATTPNLKNVKNLHVVVSAPALDALRISGTGQLDASGLSTARLEVDISGTGQMNLAGRATELRLAVAGTGAVRAKQLATTDTKLVVEGTAEATLHVTRTLDITVTGTAAINVTGKPNIKKRVSGTIALNER
jgi:hypothetical protein